MRTDGKRWSAPSRGALAFALSVFMAGAAAARPARGETSSANDGVAATPAESSGSAVAKANYGGAVQSDSAITAALCQVVYPLDATEENGYRYMFFGNGF